jgi:uncharacterized protein (DUF2267 family)
MEFHEFLGQVQRRARLSSQEEALKAVKATLETLSERLFSNEAKHVASQLPEELAVCMMDGNPGERFSVDEFFERVSRKEGVEKAEAVFHSRAVINVLCEAVSPGEMDDVRRQLPGEYSKLFAGSKGFVNPDY